MFTIEYCGYNIHNPNRDIIYRPNGSSSYLFLLILAPMEFEIDGNTNVAKAGACILYTPGFPQKYQAVNEFYNSYLHFFVESEAILTFDIPINTIFYPEGIDDINWYIKNIHKEHLTKSMHYEKQSDALLWQLFIYLDRNVRKNIPEISENASLYSEFQSLRLQMLTYCAEEWSIERLCKVVNLEKSQVYAYYHKFFHTTPKAELINARIDKAKYLLMNEALQISQVARMSGFSDIYHFSRCFKKACGCSPSSFATLINGKKKAFLHCDNN